MGYYSRLRGDLVFAPPLSDDDVESLTQEFPDLAYGGTFTGSGWLDGGDSCKQYYFHEECTRLYEFLAEHSVTVYGEVIREGEETGDVERARFTLFRPPVFEKAELRWPDGTRYRV
jgi:hypothetical protein